METTSQTWLWEKLGEKTVKALERHAFDAHLAANIDEARQVILEMISGFESFGFAGSLTTRSLGILEALREKGKTVVDHWQEGLTSEQDLDSRLQQGRCDCFLCSANALSATGEIVNVDGVGNRTAAMTFGPKKVIIAAGMNKVRHDLASALKRVQEVAGPLRAKSLNLDTPCAKTGICTDCDSPQRICRITTILHRSPSLTDVSVVLINQALGF
ncbi:MAG: lactate utilization protein [Desulfatiglandales bacterium]